MPLVADQLCLPQYSFTGLKRLTWQVYMSSITAISTSLHSAALWSPSHCVPAHHDTGHVVLLTVTTLAASFWLLSSGVIDLYRQVSVDSACSVRSNRFQSTQAFRHLSRKRNIHSLLCTTSHSIGSCSTARKALILDGLATFISKVIGGCTHLFQ